MCLAVPGKVVAVEGQIAKVDFGGVQRETNVSLVDVKVGDYVIVHAGFAIQIVDEDEAKDTLKLWEELLAAQDQGDNPEPT
jgi:hydrogenase expression/formation protein HypC